MRTFRDQITTLCAQLGITKGDLASRVGLKPSQFSERIRRPDPHLIERTAQAVDRPPTFFDEYLLSVAQNLVANNGAFLEEVRARAEGRPLKVRRITGNLPQQLFKPGDAARILGIARSTLYEMMTAGEVRYVKIGSGLRHVALSEIERIMGTEVRLPNNEV